MTVTHVLRLLLTICSGSLALRAAVPQTFTLDPAASKLTSTLCVQTQCDSDQQPMEGELWLTLDCATPPKSAGLHDLRLTSPSNHNVELDFGFGGRVGAVLSNLVIRHAAPTSLPAARPVVGGQVSFQEIPTLLGGTITYHATGLACALIQIAGLSCDGVIDLAERSTNVIHELTSQLTVTARRAVLTGSFNFTALISESDPALGEVRSRADFTAESDLKPSLGIEPGAESHLLRWCTRFEGFRVQRSATLGGPWEDVPAPATPDADQWKVSLPNETVTWFYRLAGA